MINEKQSKGGISAAKYRVVQRWLQKGNHYSGEKNADI